MKNLLKYFAITVLFTIAIIGIFCEPIVNCENQFLVLIVSKVIGFGIAYLVYVLVKAWNLFEDTINDNKA